MGLREEKYGSSITLIPQTRLGGVVTYMNDSPKVISVCFSAKA